MVERRIGDEKKTETLVASLYVDRNKTCLFHFFEDSLRFPLTTSHHFSLFFFFIIFFSVLFFFLISLHTLHRHGTHQVIYVEEKFHVKIQAIRCVSFFENTRKLNIFIFTLPNVGVKIIISNSRAGKAIGEKCNFVETFGGEKKQPNARNGKKYTIK